MAIWYCAGGDPVNIADHHGVKTDEVLRSIWKVVDAIHKAPQLYIIFPEIQRNRLTLHKVLRQNQTLALIFV